MRRVLRFMFPIFLTFCGCPVIEPSPPGPYKVGYQELTLVDTARGRTLRTAFWYPTVDGTTPEPSGGPYPLIMFSHGDNGRSTGNSNDFLRSAWASEGFVVAAPDHQKNTSYDADNSPENRAAIQFDRPGDIRFVIDQVLLLNQDTTSFLHGLVNPEAIGMSGHSFGGHTTIMMAGAPPNLDHLAQYCLTDPDNWDVCGLQDRIQALFPGQRIIDESDPRIKAALSLAGDGYGWFQADGMAKIKIPIMYAVGRLDTTCPLSTQSMPEYQGTVSTKYLFIQDKGDHLAYINGCSEQTSSDCRRLHEQISYVSIAFWKLKLKNDLASDKLLRDYAAAQTDATLLNEARN